MRQMALRALAPQYSPDAVQISTTSTPNISRRKDYNINYSPITLRILWLNYNLTPQTSLKNPDYSFKAKNQLRSRSVRLNIYSNETSNSPPTTGSVRCVLSKSMVSSVPGFGHNVNSRSLEKIIIPICCPAGII